MELGETATALQAAQTVTRLRTQNSVLNLAEGANPLVGPENHATAREGQLLGGSGLSHRESPPSACTV
jgi:hypothetical protein